MLRAKNFWTSSFEFGLNLLYPRQCSLCRSFSDLNPCTQCRAEMEPRLPVVEWNLGAELDYMASVYRYPGRAGQAVRQLKYRRSTGLAGFMAESLARAVEDEGIEYDLAVPVPIHWYRLAFRGFNQAELIARDLPHCVNGLRRVRATHPQAGLSTAQRLKNLEGAFEALADVAGKSVLLIDDVVTSGQTAKECARALRSAGAREIGMLAFCGDV